VLLLLGGATAAAAQVEKEPGTTADEELLAPLDRGELEAFLDGFVSAYLEETQTVGGVVSVVQGEEIVLAKGYGKAELESGAPVVAESTLFRIGSVSKLFVWTAVMQQVEEGKLDLEADVNDYLESFEIPPVFDEPITLTHLMTHSAGFEDRVLGLFARDASALAPLEEILRTEMPARVRPPGQVSSYSNHGTGLAMFLVERVSGVPWQTYLERRIIRPLGMAATTFSQPPPAGLTDQLAQGYRLEAGRPVAAGFEFVPLGSVGAASATATDMARFMIAHLQLGRLEQTRILEEATALRMQEELFRHVDAVNPMAHGFIDSSRNGQRIVGHGGDTLWFHTQLALFPEHGLGIFASFNTAGAVPTKLVEAFTDRYFPPADLAIPQLLAEGGARSSRLVGSYRSNRFSHSDLTKLAALMGTVEVSADEDGALITSVSGDTRWLEESPLVYREEDGQRRLAFAEAEDGRIEHLFLSDVPVVAFERVPPRENTRLHTFLFVTSMLLFVATLFLLPLGAFLRWRYRAPLERDRRIPMGASIALWLSAFIFVVFAFGLAASMQDPIEIVFGLTSGLRAVLVLPLIGALTALSALAFAVRLWREQQGLFFSRLAYTAVVVACFVVLWQLAIWRLLGGA
jgi:CubicO group peptidase (beta-lactamase class C family)